MQTLSKKIVVALTLGIVISHSSLLYAEVVNWSTPEGIERLESARPKGDFFKLANQFESQENKFFCGPATVAILLNTLRTRKVKELPVDETILMPQERNYFFRQNKMPLYQRYTQTTVMQESPKTRLEVMGITNTQPDYGFNLNQLQQLMQAHNLDTKTVPVKSSTDGQVLTIKSDLINALNTPDTYVVVNYARKTLGQKGGGHISPLGAYDKASDSFLIMDVTPSKAEWVWVTSDQLINAMAVPDASKYRGYIIVSDRLSE